MNMEYIEALNDLMYDEFVGLLECIESVEARDGYLIPPLECFRERAEQWVQRHEATRRKWGKPVRADSVPEVFNECDIDTSWMEDAA